MISMQEVLAELRKMESKLNDIDKKVDVLVAGMPARFITRDEFEQFKREGISLRRWALTTIVSILAILVPLVVLR